MFIHRIMNFFISAMAVCVIISTGQAHSETDIPSGSSASSTGDYITAEPVFQFTGEQVSRNTRSYPADPTSNIEWPSGMAGVSDIQTAFNTARQTENSQLGTSVPMLTLPSQSTWDGMGDGEKALWLINRERIDRGIDPLHGLEANVTSVAQNYAQYLLENNAFGHEEDGKTPWERLDANAAIGACHDFLEIAQNLSVYWSSEAVPLPIEQSVFDGMYNDGSSSWGHRHAILWYPYNDNGGTSGIEGFLGVGRASGMHRGYPNSDIIVMDFFDPCASWNYGSEIKGDINFMAGLDIGDAILALQLCSGMAALPVYLERDVNGDNRIGPEEAVYVLQQLSEE